MGESGQSWRGLISVKGSQAAEKRNKLSWRRGPSQEDQEAPELQISTMGSCRRESLSKLSISGGAFHTHIKSPFVAGGRGWGGAVASRGQQKTADFTPGTKQIGCLSPVGLYGMSMWGVICFLQLAWAYWHGWFCFEPCSLSGCPLNLQALGEIQLFKFHIIRKCLLSIRVTCMVQLNLGRISKTYSLVSAF